MKATLTFALAIALTAAAPALFAVDGQSNTAQPKVVQEHEYQPEVQLQLDLLQERFDELSKSHHGNPALLEQAQTNLEEMREYLETLGKSRDDTTEKAGRRTEPRRGYPLPESYLRMMRPFLKESIANSDFQFLGVNPSAPDFEAWSSDAATTPYGWEAQLFQLRGFAATIRHNQDPEMRKQLRERLRLMVEKMVEARDKRNERRVERLENELKKLRTRSERRETAEEVFERIINED